MNSYQFHFSVFPRLSLVDMVSNEHVPGCLLMASYDKKDSIDIEAQRNGINYKVLLNICPT